MNEKIVAISEITNLRLENTGYHSETAKVGTLHLINALCGYGTYDGYLIETTEHTYRILIDNNQNCCENWGYFASDDDLDSFIGKELLRVDLVDNALRKKQLEEHIPYPDDCGGTQFVDFTFTDGSVLQFAVYNDHNGYYGHPIIVAKDDLIIHQDTL